MMSFFVFYDQITTKAYHNILWRSKLFQKKITKCCKKGLDKSFVMCYSGYQPHEAKNSKVEYILCTKLLKETEKL